MATTTQNLGLIKPAGTDKIRIAQINSNMDTIDAKMGPVGSTPLQTQVTANLNKFNEANILPQAETTVPANADFNDYYAPGVFRVASDGIGQTLQNCPYAASGKLIVIARTTSASSGYTMQIWLPSSSVQRMFVRNYNGGSFSVWKEAAYLTTGTWVPHLYDLDTKLLECSPQTYLLIGTVYVAFLSYTLPSDVTIGTMLQIRNVPFSKCWSGSFYPGLPTNPSTVIQPGDSVYPRPNITGTIPSGRTIAGLFIGN